MASAWEADGRRSQRLRHGFGCRVLTVSSPCPCRATTVSLPDDCRTVAGSCARLDMHQLVGRNFVRLHKESGPAQEQLAERCGLSQQYLSGLEKGKRNPTIVTLYEIAQGLGVSHVELVRED